jgi:electron transfer flavoprotein alpha subunit
MSIIVFVEGVDGEIKKSSKEAISYAWESGNIIGINEIIAIVPGVFEDDVLTSLGKHGASKVINVNDPEFNTGSISGYSDILTDIIKAANASMLVLSKSSFSENIAGRVAGSVGAAIVSNVVSLPDISGGFMVKKSIFTGKAMAGVSVKGDIKVLLIKKNSIPIKEDGDPAEVQKIQKPQGLHITEKITGSEKATGDILLEDADIVVSGGRGLKGPENWGIVEDLARALGAATGCSKPVSDLGWRPHHEHVGQTGVKVSPNLYIAVGISGAIQHLAGVNSSKVLVAINKDPEAPFFKAADYGIVGDAFEVLPRLTKKVKTL